MRGCKVGILASQSRQKIAIYLEFWSTRIFRLAFGTVKNDRALTYLSSIDHSRYSTHFRYQITKNSLSSHQHYFCAIRFGDLMRGCKVGIFG